MHFTKPLAWQRLNLLRSKIGISDQKTILQGHNKKKILNNVEITDCIFVLPIMFIIFFNETFELIVQKGFWKHILQKGGGLILKQQRKHSRENHFYRRDSKNKPELFLRESSAILSV